MWGKQIRIDIPLSPKELKGRGHCLPKKQASLAASNIVFNLRTPQVHPSQALDENKVNHEHYAICNQKLALIHELNYGQGTYRTLN